MRKRNLLLICNFEIRSEIIFLVKVKIACGDYCQANATLQPRMIHELLCSCIVNIELGNRSFIINKSTSLDFPFQTVWQYSHLKLYMYNIRIRQCPFYLFVCLFSGLFPCELHKSVVKVLFCMLLKLYFKFTFYWSLLHIIFWWFVLGLAQFFTDYCAPIVIDMYNWWL